MALLSVADAPEITDLFDAASDPHASIRALREQAPIARGGLGMVLALRHRHLNLVTSDVTRQIETETKLMQGIYEGPIFEFIQAAMLSANGEVHQRRRAPVSRTFARSLRDAGWF